MTRRTEERREKEKRSQAARFADGEKRKPRGPLFHSGDPTLAKRLEEEVYRSER